MKDIKKYLLVLRITILFFLIHSIDSSAQQQHMFTQYLFNELIINPAYAGSHECMAATLLYRDQWVGMDGSPKTQTFNFHTPVISNKVGAGISIINETIGVSKQFSVNANLAYRVRMESSTLSFGLQGGFTNDQENLTDVKTATSNDELFSNNIHEYFLPNAGFGVYYYKEKFYAGFSIPKLLENRIDISKNSKVVRNIGNLKVWHYYFTTGFVLPVSDNIKFKPSVMIKTVVNAPMEADVNANFLFNDLIWAGCGYRTGDAVAAMFAIQLTPAMKLGYSYDYTLSKLKNFNSGSHEITLTFRKSLKKQAFISPRFF